MEQKLIAIKEGKRFEATLMIADEPPPYIHLTFEGYDWGRIEEKSLFSCMRTLHKQLDSAGVKLLCNGFRYDVRGSAMSRTPMGTRAYRLNPHKQHLTGADLVYIFDPTDDADAIVTVEEQEAYFKKYLDEAGIARPPGL